MVSGAASNVKLSVMWSWHAKAPPIAAFRSSTSTFLALKETLANQGSYGPCSTVCATEWEPV